jgi:ketosteroid isomerase-like protein
VKKIQFIIATLFILGVFAALANQASAYPPFVGKAKKFGAKDCRFCHVDPLGGPPWNERGKWLIAEKSRRKADAVDVEWLAEYTPGGKTSPAAKNSGASNTAAIEQELLKLDRQWLDAYEKGDTASLARIEADEFTVTYADGKVLTKAQDIELAKKSTAAELKLSTEDAKVRVYGDTAVITGILVQKMKEGEKEVTVRERYTDVWAKRNGRWQAVATALTTIPQPQPAPEKKTQEHQQAENKSKAEAKNYDAYVGDYETPIFLLHIIRVGDKLYGEPEGETREELIPESETQFKVTNVNAIVTFIKDGDGKVTGLDLLLNGQKLQGKKVK